MVSRSGRVALKVSLWAVPLIAVGVLPSSEVIASIVAPIVSSRRRSAPIYVHGNWGVIHPSGSV